MNYGGEGASFFTVSSEGGRNEYDPGEVGQPIYTQVPLVAPADDHEEVVRVSGAPAPNSVGPDDDDVSHLMNWLMAMQARKEPNATVDNGFSHAIVCIMAAQSYWSGKKLYWDPKNEEILEQPIV